MFRCYALTEEQFAQGEIKHGFYDSRAPQQHRLTTEDQIQSYINKLRCAGTTTLKAFDTLDAARQYAKDNPDDDSLNNTHAIIEVVLPLSSAIDPPRKKSSYSIKYNSKDCTAKCVYHSSLNMPIEVYDKQRAAEMKEIMERFHEYYNPGFFSMHNRHHKSTAENIDKEFKKNPTASASAIRDYLSEVSKSLKMVHTKKSLKDDGTFMGRMKQSIATAQKWAETDEAIEKAGPRLGK